MNERQKISSSMKKRESPANFLLAWIRGCILVLALFALVSCSSGNGQGLEHPATRDEETGAKKQARSIQPELALPAETGTSGISINPSGMTILERFPVPEGFERTRLEQGSFGDYLRSLELKADGSPVRYYNGEIKSREVHAAVVEMEIGNRDLQQCADAVMRLRAEYLYGRGMFEQIHFNFTNGFRADYAKWRQGMRISVGGSRTTWVRGSSPSRDYQSFRQYLNMVFSYAGTLSLSRELSPVQLKEMQVGDIFIRGGSPGHCVIVVDMAENKQSGEKLFMLAQSYMPAQDIHVLKNLQEESISPWYRLDGGEGLETPEWSFTANQLKRFGE